MTTIFHHKYFLTQLFILTGDVESI